MWQFGFPIDTFNLRCIVKSYLERQGRIISNFKSNFPGAEWSLSFLRRHPEITVRFSSNIKQKRAAVGVETVNEDFDHLSKEMEGVPPKIFGIMTRLISLMIRTRFPTSPKINTVIVVLTPHPLPKSTHKLWICTFLWDELISLVKKLS